VAGGSGGVGAQDAEGGEAVEDFLDVGLLGALEGGSTCGRLARALDFSEWTVMAIRLFVSEVVLAEAARGDAVAAARRIEAAGGMETLAVTPEAQLLASALLNAAALPRNAAIDAVHVALAAAHGMNFLLTWNCTRIANAVIRPRIEAVCEKQGFRPPVICTSEELVEQEQP
jgi:hypothetical protein